MSAHVADVSDFDSEVITWLPLNVERVVDGVGQLVGTVENAKGDWLSAIDDAASVGQEFCQVRSLGVGWCGQ